MGPERKSMKEILDDNFKKTTRGFLVSLFKSPTISKKKSALKAWLNYSGTISQYPGDFLESKEIRHLYSIIHDSCVFTQRPEQSCILGLISSVEGTY